MPAITSDPAAAREFALEVVAQLRTVGHEAVWAGGCVRDELLGRTPADYDVATSATPDQVRALFGRRRTLAVGAAFGVITVVGPKPAGHVEVATFRTDAAYTDGRHPAGVTFCSAEEDARRRDFTINGLFLDPLDGRVLDYVGGREDLAAGIVRAIGVPAMRFGEDHLRMLRAVRFTAGFGFILEAETRRAVETMGHLVTTVSPERIAAELRTMFARPGRGRGLELLIETGLVAHVLPEADAILSTADAIVTAARIIDALDQPSLPQALATIFTPSTSRLTAAAGRLRLSNQETRLAAWLTAAVTALGGLDLERLTAMPWSELQPWIAHEFAPHLVDLLRSYAAAGKFAGPAAAWLTTQTERPRAELDPPPLVGGSDLLGAGIPVGPAVGRLLATIRSRQLDGLLTSREAAMDFVAAAREQS